MPWNCNILAGSKRALDQQLKQSFISSNKKQFFWPCPVCNRSFASSLLDDHINQCAQPCFSGSSKPCVVFCTEPPDSISPLHSGPVITDVLSVLQATADEKLPTSGIINAQDTLDVIGAVRSPHLQCESGRPNCCDRRNCTAAFELNSDARVRSDILCTQADTNLCTDRSESTAEALVDYGRSLNHSVEEEGRLQNLAECERPESNKRKLGCQEVSEDLTETDNSLLTCEAKCTDMEVVQTFKDGNGRVVEGPPAGFKLYQRQKQSQAKLSMYFRQPSYAAEERRPSVTVLHPGMILFKNWLDLERQQRLVQESQSVAHLFHRPITSGGGKYHIYSMCWGPKWNPKTHRYAGSGAERPLPDWMFDLAQEISREAQRHTAVCPSDVHFAPDVALVNFYPVKAEELGVVGLGGHQDLDDSCTMPVVSLSVGDSMTFFFRRLPPLSRRKSMISISVDEKAAKICEDGDVAHNREQQVILRSGDVIVFGGESRLIYHGTRHVQAGTRPPGLHMVPGRLNFTFRQTDASLNAHKSRLCS